VRFIDKAFVRGRLPRRLCVPAPAGLLESLLEMHLHLAEERTRNGISVAVVSQDGQSVLDAQRLENGLRYPEGQAVERPEEQYAVNLQHTRFS
jgi:hypothetical protein